MRIGIYYHAQLERETGGGTIFQEVLLEEVRRIVTRHDVFILSPTVPARLPEDVPHVRFVRIDASRPGNGGRIVRRLKRAARRRFDCLFGKGLAETGPLERAVRELGIDLVWFISTKTERVTVPYVATVWDLAHRIHPYFPEVSVTGWTWEEREAHYRDILPRAACIITGTAAGREEIVRYYQVPEHLVQVVPFPTPQFALAPPTDGAGGAASRDLPQNYLFYPAQFWPHKNHIGLLLALNILREQYGLTFHLVLTGSDKGNLDHVREQAGELGLSDRVSFLGFVEADFLRELYRHAFAMVYPTFFGPDNLPPLEAFALGCPVIASRVAGAEEQLGDAALLFDPKDPAEMARRVKELHDAPAMREELIRRGRERAQGWTATDYVGRVLRIIDDFEPVRRCWSSREPYIHQ
ncbi:MAG TPA: glycosyltransferase family 1 protein [Desulfuromonadaceae bacterium]